MLKYFRDKCQHSARSYIDKDIFKVLTICGDSNTMARFFNNNLRLVKYFFFFAFINTEK